MVEHFYSSAIGPRWLLKLDLSELIVCLFVCTVLLLNYEMIYSKKIKL